MDELEDRAFAAFDVKPAESRDECSARSFGRGEDFAFFLLGGGELSSRCVAPRGPWLQFC
jgi:hypothetical protein